MVQAAEYALNVPDSISADSVAVEPAPVLGLVFTPPQPIPAPAARIDESTGVSFILCGVFLLFFIIALRFRNNFKYVVTMLRNVVETRTRQNVFDDTVRETSLIVLLNIMWCACAGIIGFCFFRYVSPLPSGIPHADSIGMLWGMAVAVVYTLFMWWMYAAVGWVFSDKSHSAMWVKGFTASQALMTPAFFLTALVGICQPATGLGVGVTAAVVFIFGKLIFIWKGYKIFFNQFSSWVLFLCYLCSLEIVPLILCYRCAMFLSEYFGK